MKVCSTCGIEKSIDCFYYRKDTNSTRSQCKDCIAVSRSKKWHNDKEFKQRGLDRSKKHQVLKDYGLSLETYNDIMKVGKCAICSSTTRKLVLDHSHVTGKIRGVLCNDCNTGIGLLGDEVLDLERALEYLKGE